MDLLMEASPKITIGDGNLKFVLLIYDECKYLYTESNTRDWA